MEKDTRNQHVGAEKKSGSRISTLKTASVIAGAATLAAAGYYFFYGSKEGPKRRRKVTAWSNKFKREIVKKSRELKVLDRRSIGTIIKNVSAAYAMLSSVDRDDLTAAIKELRENWKEVKREAQSAVRAKTASARRVVKKTVQKTTK